MSPVVACARTERSRPAFAKLHDPLDGTPNWTVLSEVETFAIALMNAAATESPRRRLSIASTRRFVTAK